MEDFPPHVAERFHNHSHERDNADAASISTDGSEVSVVDGEILMRAPKEQFRLGYFDVMCLVVNRMIGTGIFNSPQRVMQGTHSTGASLLLWLAGSIYCLAGVHVYIEYGLTAPRYIYGGLEQSVPRSGGDLNYLQYVYRKPGYPNNTVLLSGCMFGVAFICLGNMAGNSLNFAMRIMGAAGVDDPSNGTVRGIALATAVITCFIHTISRRGGIVLNNVLAIIKLMILLLIIVVAIVVAARGLPHTPNLISQNTDASKSFAGASTDANGYAQAFLSIIFAFSGFEQPNYVMGEISHPRRKHPISSIVGVSTVIVLYMAVNVSYMVVVDFQDTIHGSATTAQVFFENTLGQLSSSNPGQAKRIFDAFLAIASLGNIIVMTYTAARVKQEIAKEGILPWAKFFAQDRDLSLGRLLRWFQKKRWFTSLLNTRWLSPEQHTERTPVGAFALHLIFVFILIFATWGMSTNEAYTLLTGLSAYTINAFFGIFLGLGILILRTRGPPPSIQVDDVPLQHPIPTTWREMAGPRINPVLSVISALVYMAGGLYPVITTWIKPTGDIAKTLYVTWYLIPTISWAVIVAGIVWFLGFVAVVKWTYHKYFKVFNVEKKPHFEAADAHDEAGEAGGQGGGGLVLVHETVCINWVGEEFRQRKPGRGNEMEEASMDNEHGHELNDFEGTDFAAYQRQQQQQQQNQFDAGYGTGYQQQGH